MMEIVTSETDMMFAMNTGRNFEIGDKIKRTMHGYVPELLIDDLLRASDQEWTAPLDNVPPNRRAVFCKIVEKKTKEVLYEIAFYDKESRRFFGVMRGGTPVFIPDNYEVAGWKDAIRRRYDS